MSILEALNKGKKVRIDFLNDIKAKRFFLVFDKVTDLARMLNFMVTNLKKYGHNDIDYQATVYIYEEEEIWSNVAEA